MNCSFVRGGYYLRKLSCGKRCIKKHTQTTDTHTHTHTHTTDTHTHTSHRHTSTHKPQTHTNYRHTHAHTQVTDTHAHTQVTDTHAHTHIFPLISWFFSENWKLGLFNRNPRSIAAHKYTHYILIVIKFDICDIFRIILSVVSIVKRKFVKRKFEVN